MVKIHTADKQPPQSRPDTTEHDPDDVTESLHCRTFHPKRPTVSYFPAVPSLKPAIFPPMSPEQIRSNSSSDAKVSLRARSIRAETSALRVSSRCFHPCQAGLSWCFRSLGSHQAASKAQAALLPRELFHIIPRRRHPHRRIGPAVVDFNPVLGHRLRHDVDIVRIRSLQLRLIDRTRNLRFEILDRPTFAKLPRYPAIPPKTPSLQLRYESHEANTGRVLVNQWVEVSLSFLD